MRAATNSKDQPVLLEKQIRGFSCSQLSNTVEQWLPTNNNQAIISKYVSLLQLNRFIDLQASIPQHLGAVPAKKSLCVLTMWRRAAFGVGRSASATSLQTVSILPRSLSSSRTSAAATSSSRPGSRSTASEAGDRPARSYGGRGSSSSSTSSRGRDAGRGRGGRQQHRDDQQWNSSSNGSSGNSSRGARSPGRPPPRARDILLKPRRSSAVVEQQQHNSSSDAAATVLPALGSSSSGVDDPTYVPR